MPTNRIVSDDCSPMCKLLDGPTKRRQMPSICICGRGAVCGFTPMSSEKLDEIERWLDEKTTTAINANTARIMLEEIRWLHAQLDAARKAEGK